MPADSYRRSCRKDHMPSLHSPVGMLVAAAEAGVIDTVPQMRAIGIVDMRVDLARKQPGRIGRIEPARIGMARIERVRIGKQVGTSRWQGKLEEQNPMLGYLVVFAGEGIGGGQAERGQQ
jgi:hypothetical protein